MPLLTTKFQFADETQNYVIDAINRRITGELGDQAAPEQLRALFLQKGDEYVKALTKDHWTYPSDFSSKIRDRLEEIGKSINPYYEPLSTKEKETRSAVAEAFRRNYTEYAATRELNARAVKIPPDPYGVKRVAFAFLYVGNTQEVYDKNDALMARLMSQDPEVRRDAFLGRIRELADKKLDQFDLTNPKSIADHMMEFGEVMAVGCEIDKQRELLHAEEDYGLFEQANVMFEISSIMRLGVDIYASSLYGEVRTEELSQLGRAKTYWDLVGDNVNILSETEIAEKGLERAANYFYNTLSAQNQLVGDSPLMDTTKTPSKRVEVYRSGLWEKTADDEFGIKPDPAWEGRNSQWVRNCKDEEKVLRARIPELREKLEKNLELLQKLDPTITLSDEEKDRMFSEENIALSVRARAMKKRAVQINKAANDGTIPKNTVRILQGFIKADEKNDREKAAEMQEFRDLMNSDTPEAADRRKQLIIDKLNRVGAIDPKKIDLSKPIAASAKEAMENYDLYCFGFELPNFTAGLADSFGLWPKDAKELKAYVKRGQSLGTDGLCAVSELADDLYFTLPLDRMSGLQMQTLGEELLKNKGISKLEYARLMDFGINKMAYEDPAHVEEMKPFETVLESDALVYPQKEEQLEYALRDDPRSPEKRFSDRLAERLKALKKEDSVFIFSNSAEFGNLKRTLTQAEKMIRDQLQADDRKPVDRELTDRLGKAAREYVSHVEKQEGGAKNDRQSRRLDIAKQLIKDLDSFASEKIRVGDRMRVEAGILSEVAAARKQNEEMQLFEKGIERTDEMMQEQLGRDPFSIEYILNDRMIEARGEIANQSGREVPNASTVSDSVSRVIAAKMLLNQKGELAEMQKQLPAEEFFSKMDRMYDRMKERIENDPAVSEQLRQMDGHELNRFLAGGGERELMNLFVRSESREHQRSSTAPEASRTLSAGKRALESEEAVVQ